MNLGSFFRPNIINEIRFYKNRNYVDVYPKFRFPIADVCSFNDPPEGCEHNGDPRAILAPKCRNRGHFHSLETI